MFGPCIMVPGSMVAARRRAIGHVRKSDDVRVTSGRVRVLNEAEVDLRQAFLVVGLPTVGYVGAIATSYLATTGKLGLAASVVADDFPPMAVVRDGIALSPMRIVAGPAVCGVDGECDQLAVVLADFTPPATFVVPVAVALLDWAAKAKIKEILCLEGFKVERLAPGEPVVYGLCSEPAANRCLQKMKVQPFLEGVVPGLAGVLSYRARERKLPVTCLFVETSAAYPDARGAARLLETMAPLVPHISIDPKPLYAEAEAIEGNMRRAAAAQSRGVSAIEEQSSMMYG